ncbi:helix-turn-helix domain-containing protein [Aestuariivirga sp.]|uniref:helix-turn-helix domain-containing protein n=1 Tax=Aestuariivirga sp. TaxID=2650926 RepID=UPI0039E36CD7
MTGIPAVGGSELPSTPKPKEPTASELRLQSFIAIERPLVFSVPEACHLLRISRTVLYEHIARGTLKPIKRGRRTLFHRDEVERFAAITLV